MLSPGDPVQREADRQQPPWPAMRLALGECPYDHGQEPCAREHADNRFMALLGGDRHVRGEADSAAQQARLPRRRPAPVQQPGPGAAASCAGADAFQPERSEQCGHTQAWIGQAECMLEPL
jgi:hypothetical protein